MADLPKGQSTSGPSHDIRLDKSRARRALDLQVKKAQSAAHAAWILPIVTFCVAIVGLEIFKWPKMVFGSVNIILILISSSFTIRTWVNIVKNKIPGLWFGAIAGTILNGLLLFVLGWAIAFLIRH
jgi:hypothetical protein